MTWLALIEPSTQQVWKTHRFQVHVKQSPKEYILGHRKNENYKLTHLKEL